MINGVAKFADASAAAGIQHKTRRMLKTNVCGALCGRRSGFNRRPLIQWYMHAKVL
jgi:hypothetical protein